MTQKNGDGPVIERLFSVRQVCQLWHAGPDLVRKAFRGRQGIVQLGGRESRGRKGWRIPASLVLEVMIEMGYTREQAERAMRLRRGMEG